MCSFDCHTVGGTLFPLDVMKATFTCDGYVLTNHGTLYTELKWYEGEFGHFVGLIELAKHEEPTRIRAQSLYNLKLLDYIEAYNEQCKSQALFSLQKDEDAALKQLFKEKRLQRQKAAEDAKLKELFKEKRMQRQKAATEDAKLKELFRKNRLQRQKATPSLPLVFDSDNVTPISPNQSVTFGSRTAVTTPERSPNSSLPHLAGTKVDINDLFKLAAKEHCTAGKVLVFEDGETPKLVTPFEETELDVKKLLHPNSLPRKVLVFEDGETPKLVTPREEVELDIEKLLELKHPEKKTRIIPQIKFRSSQSSTLVPTKGTQLDYKPPLALPYTFTDTAEDDLPTPSASKPGQAVFSSASEESTSTEEIELPPTPEKYQRRFWQFHRTEVTGVFLPNYTPYMYSMKFEEIVDEVEDDDKSVCLSESDIDYDWNYDYWPDDFEFYMLLLAYKPQKTYLPGDFFKYKELVSQKEYTQFYPGDFYDSWDVPPPVEKPSLPALKPSRPFKPFWGYTVTSSKRPAYGFELVFHVAAQQPISVGC